MVEKGNGGGHAGVSGGRGCFPHGRQDAIGYYFIRSNHCNIFGMEACDNAFPWDSNSFPLVSLWFSR